MKIDNQNFCPENQSTFIKLPILSIHEWTFLKNEEKKSFVKVLLYFPWYHISYEIYI